jgi:hypothetical protein
MSARDDIYCDHAIGWFDSEDSGIEFISESELSEFVMEKRAYAEAVAVSFSEVSETARIAAGYNDAVDLLAMTDGEIIGLHVCAFKFCPACGKEHVGIEAVATAKETAGEQS